MAARPGRPAAVLTAALIAIAVSSFSGCDEEPTAPDFHLPRSPEQLVSAVEWSYDHQSPAAYRDLFTADFQFACARADSAGNVYRDTPWTRDDELQFFSALVNPQRHPPITKLTLDFDRNLVVSPDPRPGKDPEHHRWIRTGYVLTVAEGSAPPRTVFGQIGFFVVRGDSAAIPDDLAVRGSTTDSRVWYLQRWEDATGEWCALRGQ